MSETYRYMDFWFDDGRLKRSEDIKIISLSDGGRILDERYYLALSDNHHYVTIHPHLDCDCDDFAWGPDRLCKHLIAALRFEGDKLLEQVILSNRPEPVVTLVCGPPAAGKSTYVRDHAAPYDLLWDYDAISRAIQVDGDGRSVNTRPFVVVIRDAFMRKLKDMVDDGTLQTDAWVVWSLPRPGKRSAAAKALNANVVVLEREVEECVENAKKDRSTEEVIAVERGAIDWWEAYRPLDGEERV